MKRIDCLKILASQIQDELVVVTLGVTKGEWDLTNPRDGNLFLSGMGTTAPFGLGLALAIPHRKVVVLESDGSMLFGLNVLATLAVQNPKNLSMIVVRMGGLFSASGGSSWLRPSALRPLKREASIMM